MRAGVALDIMEMRGAGFCRSEGSVCEVCGAPFSAAHRHVIDRPARKVLCACGMCARSFRGNRLSRFRSVPETTRPVFLAETLLDRLGISSGVAFFFRPSSLGQWLAVAPCGIAGAIEAELGIDAVGVLNGIAVDDDVETLVVRRPRDRTSACYVAPIAVGYELTAILRQHWRGADGGDAARAALEELFARIERETEEAA